MGVPHKRFGALPVLTVSFRHVEACRGVAEHFFSHWFQAVLRAPDLGGVNDARAWNKHQFIQ
jgi:hypothetical protein